MKSNVEMFLDFTDNKIKRAITHHHFSFSVAEIIKHNV